MSSRRRIPPILAAPAIRACAALFAWALPAVAGCEDGEPSSEASIQFLEVDFHVGRDGRVESEARFRIPVDGERIQRGPVLDFLTAFEGPGGLVLESGLEVLLLERDGEPEPYHLEDFRGIMRVYCGEEAVLLEPGTYDYRLRWRALGTWAYRDGLALAAFDVTEPFRDWPIEAARVDLFLPDGVALRQYTPAVAGVEGTAPGYRVVEGEGSLTVETTGPLAAGSFFALNAVWPSEGFAGRIRWLEVMKQHPRLPVSAAVAGLLFVLFCLLLTGRFPLRRATRPAAAGE